MLHWLMATEMSGCTLRLQAAIHIEKECKAMLSGVKPACVQYSNDPEDPGGLGMTRCRWWKFRRR